MDYTDEARQIFKDDIFATETSGIIIEKADDNYAKCVLKIEPKHLNAHNQVMGGAIFTLADFTFAIAANMKKAPTVTLSSTIQFLSTVKGKELIAETVCLKSGKSSCQMEVLIKDELGTAVAHAVSTGFRKSN